MELLQVQKSGAKKKAPQEQAAPERLAYFITYL
jgi:hypothetical protein